MLKKMLEGDGEMQSRQTYKRAMEKIIVSLEASDISTFRQHFLQLHASDQVDIFYMLSDTLQKRCFEFLSPKEFAEIFQGLEPTEQEEVFQVLDIRYFSDVLNEMFTDNIVQFLMVVDEETRSTLLQQMKKSKAKKIAVLLQYKQETAGSLMTKEFVAITEEQTVAEVMNYLREAALTAEVIYYAYVTDVEGHLVGVISLRELLTARPEATVKEMMNTHAVSVDEHLDQEEVASIIQKYDLLAVPVVSKHDHLLGIITVDDVIDVMEAETTEDFGELSAVKGATDLDMSAFQTAKKRSPWIVLLMFLGLITASVINSFEETLEQVLLLGIFVPMIMDSAGNVGTQSLTVSVRGLTLGTLQQGKLWSMVRRELSTGFMMGILCMITISLAIPVFYGDWQIGFIVGISILFTLTISAAIGAIVPLIIHKLNFDPAIASGPFITTINDIIGLFIYFSIASSLLNVV